MGLLSRLRARRSNPGEPRTYRLANSIRLPWAVGLASMLLLALVAVLLIGRTGEQVPAIPDAILDAQEGTTRQVAQSVRRSLNEGIDDLAEFAALVPPGYVPAPARIAQLQALATTHGRYSAAYLLGPQGEVLAGTGAPPAPGLVDLRVATAGPGMTDAKRVVDAPLPVIAQYAPLAVGEPRQTVVAHYDPAYLRFPMEGALPGSAWVVNPRGEVVAGTVGFLPLSQLPRRALREAAARATAGGSGGTVVGGSLESSEVVSWAPVGGDGPAGALGWGVVTSRSVASISLPQTNARRQGALLGIVLALLSLLIFAWLWLIVVGPMLRLQRQAERLAYGDLSKPVPIVRYDEIGLASRSLERLRVLLIRRRVQGDTKLSAPSDTGGNGAPAGGPRRQA